MLSPVSDLCKGKKKRSAFTFQEDCILSHLVQLFGSQKWDLISSCMIDRTPRQCRERWKSYLTPGLSNGPWSEQEDNMLLELHERFGPKWVQISKYFNGRSDSNIKNRWYTHLAQSPKRPNIESIQPEQQSEEPVLSTEKSGFPFDLTTEEYSFDMWNPVLME